MPTYSYRCREEEKVFEIEASWSDQPKEAVPCPSCRSNAFRYYQGQKFYGRIKGAHGGGPATK